MGNDGSKHKSDVKTEKVGSEIEKASNPTLEAYFTRISDGKNEISAEKLKVYRFFQFISLKFKFQSIFQQDLSGSLMKYLTGDTNSNLVTHQQFMDKFTPLYGTSTDIYVKSEDFRMKSLKKPKISSKNRSKNQEKKLVA